MPETTNLINNKKQRLGRGLGSLLGGSETNATQHQPHAGLNEIPLESRVWKIAVDKIYPSPYQPRKSFDKQALTELSQSIKTHGILQPIIVKKNLNGSFELIAGERRWRASQEAGLHEVPAIIKNLSKQDTLELAIIENIQREDLGPIEEAEAFQRLMDEFEMTQQQVAEKLGRERASIANSLRLLSLPQAVRQLISNKEISPGHAKVLLSLKDPLQIEKLAKAVAKKQLTVRKLEALIKNYAEGAAGPEDLDHSSQKIKNAISSIEDEIQKLLQTKVKIAYDHGKGSIQISFYSQEGLDQIVDKLRTV